MNHIPDWAVQKLGKHVVTKVAFDDGVTLWPARSLAILVSIQAGDDSPYATCVLRGAGPQAEENFSFSDISPVG